MVIPYTKRLSECFKNICNQFGIQAYFEGGNTIKNLLLACRDKNINRQKSGMMYTCKCDREECDEGYIGESARTFGETFKEHLRTPSPIYDHVSITGHQTSIDRFSVVGMESHNLTRTVKEAIYIRVNNLSLNRNIRKYELLHNCVFSVPSNHW